jgi:HSP20 family protein
MENITTSYLRQLQGSLGDLTYELRIRYLSVPREQTWTPAINAYRCREQIVVCVDLAGVDKEQIKLHAEPRRLSIRGVRQPLDLTVDECPPLQVFALEIDQGLFHREIALPLEIDPAAVRAEQRNGMLWIHLPLTQ